MVFMNGAHFLPFLSSHLVHSRAREIRELSGPIHYFSSVLRTCAGQFHSLINVATGIGILIHAARCHVPQRLVK